MTFGDLDLILTSHNQAHDAQNAPDTVTCNASDITALADHY